MGRTKKNQKQNNIIKIILIICVAVYIFIDLYGNSLHPKNTYNQGEILNISNSTSYTDETPNIPEYNGTPSYTINNNQPLFTDDEYHKAENTFIELSELDWLNRCGSCMASVSVDALPKAEREDISSVRPSGWQQELYPDIISKNDGALYNRCHLLMYALTGLNAEPRNLITGTEYLNTTGMLPYERAVQNWLYKNKGHVLYKVTPDFRGNELVARGVYIEAADVETKGGKFHINTYCYNVEPGIDIDYSTGASKRQLEKNDK